MTGGSSGHERKVKQADESTVQLRSREARGGAETPPGKTHITLRLDTDVLHWFRDQVHTAGGGNHQTLINNALRDYVGEKREPLEPTLRRVLREELHRTLMRGGGTDDRSLTRGRYGSNKSSEPRWTRQVAPSDGQRDSPSDEVGGLL